MKFKVLFLDGPRALDIFVVNLGLIFSSIYIYNIYVYHVYDVFFYMICASGSSRRWYAIKSPSSDVRAMGNFWLNEMLNES